jgi:hypothetical protein
MCNPQKYKRLFRLERVRQLFPGAQKGSLQACILVALIPGKGGEVQINTAMRVLAEIITSDASLLVTFNQVIDGVSKNSGVPGKIPYDFRRTAVRNLVRAGVAPSAAMKIVGHKTEPIYRRYAIAEEKTLIESADELEQFHAFDQQYAKPSK